MHRPERGQWRPMTTRQTVSGVASRTPTGPHRVIQTTAAAITAASPVPTIGIGAGAECDGQVLVLHDMLGLDSGHRRPRFVRDFLVEGGSVDGAVRAYVAAVRDGSFPGPEHSYR